MITSVSSLFAGLFFADEKSLNHATEAEWLARHTMRGAFAILGPSGSGKTILAKRSKA